MLEDYRTAKIPERVRATLGFLEVMTLRPEKLGPDDARRVYAQGVSEAALTDAVYVSYLFNWIDRIADALGFIVGPPEHFHIGAKTLLKRGYR